MLLKPAKISQPRCIDCAKEGIANKRKVSGKPSLCATHRRARRTSRRDYLWEKHLRETYDLSSDEYWQLYEAQEGKCYICDRPRARDRKKLSVDHCHATGRIRGLLCQRCNRDVLGYFRDEIAAFVRGQQYLTKPPAYAVIGVRVVPSHEGEQH
ncbi:endonuclease VII domain-containing protein [Nocardia arthritidis]|uniref:Recombination endonuclease VII n=1 Tax=Nocardia arthritidis TaxID=228602 RepID=A0A6G9YT26_9NOCA|nr:endonuclease VII domain-containing protein [Nocardia arthritidis]QIS16469.1 hypothetical protein F5544_43310 [Nocardia arthritidis]